MEDSDSSQSFGIKISENSLLTEEEGTVSRPYVFGKNDLKIVQELGQAALVGQGGFGTIHKVEWMGTEYAQKQFRIKGDMGAFNFLYETSIYSQLFDNSQGSENVMKLEGVKIDYLGNDSFNANIIMEYCSYGDMDKIIRGKTQRSNNQKLKWCQEIAAGISFLHRNNIIHNDLKPANILLDKDYKAKIADFGISKNAENTKMTYKIGVSVRYSPYEILIDQVQGEIIMSKKSDVWMLGGIIFFIFYQVQPWEGKNNADIQQLVKERKNLIQNSNIDEQKRALVPQQIYNILQNKIFNHDYQKRPDIEEVLKDLKEINIPDMDE